MPRTSYESPFVKRYSSERMSYVWSDENKYLKWRMMWSILAESQRILGLKIRQDQIDELNTNLEKFDFDRISEIEKANRHDVMAHLQYYGEICPKAKPILHLGATSCFITDNSELLMLVESMQIIQDRIGRVINSLGDFAKYWAKTPCLSYTHGQPAQPTTIGKRACMWNSEFVNDWREITLVLKNIKARGAKGTTGTQASYLSLFDGDVYKVKVLDSTIAQRMGFEESYETIGQTYSRKIDSYIINCLVNFAQSAYKFANDIRILARSKEIEENFGYSQVGSSAMAYKRNPIKCERICSLSRVLMGYQSPTIQTAANQWLERSLDDSASRRIILAEAFLCADVISIALREVIEGLVVNENIINELLTKNMPFMITEELIIQAVKRGYDRQEVHEIIRVESKKALMDTQYFKALLKNHEVFQNIDLEALLDPMLYSGTATKQVALFFKHQVIPIVDTLRPQDVVAQSGNT